MHTKSHVAVAIALWARAEAAIPAGFGAQQPLATAVADVEAPDATLKGWF